VPAGQRATKTWKNHQGTPFITLPYDFGVSSIIAIWRTTSRRAGL
jgi:hypothetical protein